PFSRATRSWNCLASISPLTRGASAAKTVAPDSKKAAPAARRAAPAAIRTALAVPESETRLTSETLHALDRAAEGLGLRLRHGLAGEQSIEGVLEVRGGHLGGVVGVLVDAAVVPELSRLVDDVDLGSVARAVLIRDLVVRVLHDRERVAVLL